MQSLCTYTSKAITHLLCHVCIFQFSFSFLKDGGSLDLILKKAGRIPEPVLGVINISVSDKCHLPSLKHC